ncbi:MAG: protein kinase [Lentisphaeraceae bacterium]|nr:protein kinase [Lentisphaeraceae bacterium]
MDENKDKLDEAFNETVDGFAELFNETDDGALEEDFESDLPLSRLPKDKYSIIDSVDEGGMKKILKVEDSDTTRTLAMAVIKDQKLNSRAAERFIYEARITALLQHPNIVPVHDIGLNDKGEPYFTMKLISGENLMKILNKLEKGDPEYIKNFPLSELLIIFLKSCDALAYAHANDVIHLDLKPDNIQVSAYGEVLVVDWGLAKILHNPFDDNEDFDEIIDSVDLTLNGFIKGTPGYMAPEQALGNNQEKTKLTDVYSLGAILYSILTLKKPFEEKDLEELCRKTIQGDLPSPRQRAPERNIPAALEAVCMKAMSPFPENRYQSVDELLKEILAYREGFSTLAEDANYFTELKLLIKRHKAIAALVIIGFIISTVFIVQLMNNEKTILNTVSRLEEEKTAKIEVSKLAAPRILKECKEQVENLDFNKALKLVMLSVELDHEFQEAWELKGQLHFGKQQFKEAVSAFSMVGTEKSLQYLSLLKRFNKPFEQLKDEEVLALIKELHRLDSDDHITIQLFKHLNKLNRPITEKVSLVSKALDILNNTDSPYTFTCFFRDGNLDMILNDSWVIHNITPLIALPVTRLELRDTSINDIRILKTMPLQHLNLSYAPVKEISSLRDTNIEQLFIRGTRVSQLEDLRYMKNLKKIHVDEDISTILETLMALDMSSKIQINNDSLEVLKEKYRSRLLQMQAQ